VPAGKQLAWMAGVALATLLAFEHYKAKKSGASGGSGSRWGS
jgi:hypothetical protein